MDDLIKQLIEFVKAASPVLWEAAYRQVMVWGIVNGFVLVLSLVTMIIGARLIITARKKEGTKLDGDNYYERYNSSPVCILWGCIMGTCVAVWLLVLPPFLTAVLNPTYAAIVHLSSLVR